MVKISLISITLLVFMGSLSYTQAEISENTPHAHQRKKTCKCAQDCQCKECKCKTHECLPNCKAATKNPFLKMMDDMMIQMDKAVSTTSVEEDFLAQMIFHHKGAVAMAKYEIANGKNFEMIQLAKSILAEQEIEIQKMNIMLKMYAKEKSSKVTKKYRNEMAKTMTDMMDTMPQNNPVFKNTDLAFATIMLPHHQAAIDMALVTMKYSKNKHVSNLAKKIIADQAIEIEQMKTFIEKTNKE